MSVNLTFSGQLGSGKTTVSKMLAERIAARWNSFGNTVKRIAQERRIPVERDALQDLGADLVANTPEAFCRRVIREAEPSSGNGLVLDGLRHAAILKHLQQILQPSPVVQVFVDVDNAVRLLRIKQRGGVTAEDLRRLESHSTEIEVMEALRESADLRADNSGNATTTVEQIVTSLVAKGLLELPQKA